MEIAISQKFIDSWQVIPVVEIIQLDADLDDYDTPGHRPGDTPDCLVQCFVAGHKVFNGFSLVTSLPAGTLFRVWLYKDEKNAKVKLLHKGEKAPTCVNFALSVRTFSVKSLEHEEKLQQSLLCEHTTYLPKSFNRARYLGPSEDEAAKLGIEATQRDFMYVEHFRVDNLQHKGRGTEFTLTERTLVRIDGLEHDSLIFYVKIFKGKQQVAGQDEEHLLPGT